MKKFIIDHVFVLSLINVENAKISNFKLIIINIIKSIMIAKNLLRRLCGYKVVKSVTNEGPLPSMIKYSLQSDSGEPLSFWTDIPINF